MIRQYRHTGGRLRAAVLLGIIAGQGGCFSEPSSSSGTGDDAATTTAPVESSGGSTDAVTLDPTTESGPADADSGLSPDGSSGDAPGDTSEAGSDDGSSSSGVADSGDDTGGSSEGSTGAVAPLGVDELVPGDLVLTEVMWNPRCGGDACEWLEILNTTAFDVNLLDLYVRDNDDNAGNQGRVTDDVIVGPGELVIIARGAGTWPYEFDAAAVYGPNPGLNNNRPDRVSIRNEAEMLDETATFPFDADEGIAWSLSGNALDAVSNDSGLNWCLATTVLPTDVSDEFGTPLVMNDAC